MKGFILSLYLDNNITPTNNREEFQYMSWSPYDRIEIKEVKSFAEFFNAQFQTKWIGVAQQMHLLHEYPDEYTWMIGDKTGQNVLIGTKDSHRIYGLCAVVSVRLKREPVNLESFRRKFYERLRKETEHISEMEWNAFYSLGAEDIVFLVLANNVQRIQHFVHLLVSAQITNDGEELFSIVNSFINMNQLRWKENPGAGLVMRLTLQSGKEADVQKVIQKLSGMGIPMNDIRRLFMGKCVLDVKIPADKVKMDWYFSDGAGPFNGESAFYKQYIDSSRSYWVVDDTGSYACHNITLNDERFVEPRNDYEKAELKNLEKLINKCQEIPMAQFVIKEYQRLIHSRQSGKWSLVLAEQFEVVKRFLLDYVENQKMEQMYFLLKELQNILLHIRQSTISATEVPYLNYVYAGSYNDIMKMYYGIISELFQIGYQMGHDEKICQYNITFCVDFESTTKIYSDMYMLSDPTIMERFVIFHLPFDAFTDIESTVKFLAHEIFHYIAPFSRKERNKKLTLIWSKKLIQGLVEGLTDHYDFSEEIQSSLEKEYCREEDEHMKPLFDNIYLCMKGLMENDSIDFDRIIINGFMKGTPYVWHFYEAYNKIIEMVLGDIFSKYPLVVKKICEKHRLSSLEGKVEDLAYREVSKKLNSKEDFHYAIKMLNDIANSYREAFCDLNAAFLFEMNAEDYLNFFYNLKIKSTVTSLKEQKFMQQLSQSQNRGAALDALGERLGMVLDELCGIGSNKNELNDFLPKESDLEKDDCFQQLKNYIDKIYDQFQNTERLFRKRYANLFGEIDYFWKEENPEEVQKIKRKFCEIKGCKDDLEKCLRIVNYFANR